MSDMAQILRNAIKRDGRTQKAIALAAGIDPSQLTRFVKNERGLTLTTLDPLCRALGLELRPRRPAKQKGRR